MAIPGHFEWASTSTINVFPRKGPAKSTWSRDHGLVGHSHECREPLGSYFFGMVGIFLQVLQICDHTAPLAKDSMREIPGFPSCRIRIITSLPTLDTTTRLPQRRQSSCTLSSWLFILYWEVSGPFGTSFQFPWLTASLTLEMNGSSFVRKRLTLHCYQVCSIRTMSPGVGTSSSEGVGICLQLSRPENHLVVVRTEAEGTPLDSRGHH